MKLVNLNAEIVDDTSYEGYRRMVNKVTEACCLCWNKGIPESIYEKEKFIRARIKVGHLSVLEHANISVLFTLDRGLSHELVRHRIASYTQSSTRYIDYSDMPVVVPFHLREGRGTIEGFEIWSNTIKEIEKAYGELKKLDIPTDTLRSILPNALATKVMTTYNVRTWRHVLALRNLGLTGRPHPDMVQVTKQVSEALRTAYPVFFENINELDR